MLRHGPGRRAASPRPGRIVDDRDVTARSAETREGRRRPALRGWPPRVPGPVPGPGLGGHHQPQPRLGSTRGRRQQAGVKLGDIAARLAPGAEALSAASGPPSGDDQPGAGMPGERPSGLQQGFSPMRGTRRRTVGATGPGRPDPPRRKRSRSAPWRPLHREVSPGWTRLSSSSM